MANLVATQKGKANAAKKRIDFPTWWIMALAKSIQVCPEVSFLALTCIFHNSA
jgi:hypothetical protein